jgi:formylglycine-generating enzyme required for sulfatase activity
MVGNLFEMCDDYFSPDYYSQSPKNDPPGPRTGTHRMSRGGCYMYYFDDWYRSAWRTDYRPFGDSAHRSTTLVVRHVCSDRF